MSERKINRRDFLKASVVTAAGASLVGVNPLIAAAATKPFAVPRAYRQFDGVELVLATLDGELSGGVDAQIAALKEATGITLTVSKSPQTEFRQKIAADLASGAGVYDIVIEPYVFLHDHMASGTVIPLDDYIAKDDKIDVADFIPALYNAYGKWTDGKVYALPFKPDTHIFYYRKDLFEDPKIQAAYKTKYKTDLKVPTTHEEHIQIAQFFTKKLNPESPTDYGFVFWGDPIGAFWQWGLRLGSFGGDYFDKDMKPAINSEAGKKALDVMVKLLETTPETIGQYEWDKLNTAFISGKVATAENWPGLAILSETPSSATTKSEVVGKVGYAIPPGAMVDGKLNQVSILGGWAASVSKFSKNPEAAYAAVAWMTGKDGEPLKIAAGNAPARTSTYSKIETKGTNVHLPAMLECLGVAKIGADIDLPPVSTELQDVLKTDFNKVWTGQLKPADALGQMEEKWNKILKDAGLSS